MLVPCFTSCPWALYILNAAFSLSPSMKIMSLLGLGYKEIVLNESVIEFDWSSITMLTLSKAIMIWSFP